MRDKAELLNHTFVSHFNTTQLPINHADIPPVNSEGSCDSILCSEEEVYNLLCSLDTTKSNGDDDISAIMLHNTAFSITEAVTNMFNTSISLGELPDEWKVSRFTPIPKHGDRTNPSNYRSISLLSILSNVYPSLSSYFCVLKRSKTGSGNGLGMGRRFIMNSNLRVTVVWTDQKRDSDN